MKLNRRHIIFTAVLGLFLVVFVELGLAVLAAIFPAVDRLLAVPGSTSEISPKIADERLVYRPNPEYPGHDRKGFRNPEVPAKAEIVALGDSQTYGAGVALDQAWPRQLARLAGKSVYSMAYGGYGPTHSSVLWEEAIGFSPRIVIEAIYAGNDFYDAFNFVYNQGKLPELKSADAEIVATIVRAEETDPIATRVRRMYLMEAEPSARSFLSRHSKIYGFLRRARHAARQVRKPTPEKKWQQAKAYAKRNAPYAEVFDDGTFRTVFTSEYRLAALDLDDPRIAEGLQLSLRATERMHAMAKEKGVRFLAVLIPSKEAVFQERWKTPSDTFRKLTENEQKAWATAKAFFERNGIQYLDALPALREQLAAGVQPYQVSSDGHPNEQGHEAIAKLVAQHLESNSPSAGLQARPPTGR